MRLTSDYIVKNRQLLVTIIITSCPDDSEIEIEGKLPKELNESIKEHIGSNKNKYIINENSRNALKNVFVEKTMKLITACLE